MSSPESRQRERVRSKRVRFSLGAAAIGGIIAAFTLFAGALPVAASGGSAQFTMGQSSVSATAGTTGNTLTFSPHNVTGSTGGVCFEPAFDSFTAGLDLSDFTFSPETITVANETTATQTFHYSVRPGTPTGSATLTLGGCDSSTVTGTGSPQLTTINVTAAPSNVPILLNITPTHGPTGTPVTLTLANAVQVTSVAFGSQSVAQNAVISSFIVNAPAGSGTVDVTVSNALGSTTLAQAFTYDPAVTGISPSSGPAGSSVTISGSNFTGLQSVKFDTYTANVLTYDDDSITATVPSGPSIGTVADVIVTANGVQSANTAADDFTYAATPGPTITGVTGVCTLAGGTTIDVTGTGFALGATATIGGAPTNIIVNTTNSATVTCPSQSSVGNYNLVLTSNGQSTSPFAVTYAAAPAPTVTDLSPDSGPLTGGNSVTVTGTNFQSSGLVVKFGANTATCSSVTSTSMSCVAPAGSAGTVDVVVAVNSVASTTSAASEYTYTAAPVVTAISPTTGGTGTSVTVSGFGFTGTTAVRFGTTTVATADVTLASDTTITVVVPTSLATGVYDITVTTPNGTSATSAADQFTVTAGNLATIILRGHFTLIGWVGQDGMSVTDALKGGPGGPQNGTTDVTSQVSVVWGYNTTTQTFQGYFPSAANVPGANDLNSLSFGSGYFVGLNDATAGSVTWKVEIGS